MAASYYASADGGTTATTTTTIVIPSLTTTSILAVVFTSRDHTSGTALPTVVDNNGGAAWTRIALDTNRVRQFWWKPYEANLAGKTITIADAVGSLAATLRVINGGYQSGGAVELLSTESQSSGDESHASVTPTYADSALIFAVFNTNPLPVTSVTAATTGNPTNTGELLSTGGGDSAVSVSVWDAHPASGSGAITWSQANALSYSAALAVRPSPPGTFQAAWARGSNGD